jgi:hypothetical protein
MGTELNSSAAFVKAQRTILLRSMYVLTAPVFMIFAALACAGTPLAGSPVFTCPTPVPQPTVTTLAGTPMPTPLAQPTPYVILPPAEFFVGDAVFIGSSGSANGVRFRLQNVSTQATSPSADGSARNIFAWQLEVKNIGLEVYEIFPSGQMVLSAITTANGDETGVWPATREAANAIGASLDENVDTLHSGETRVFRFAAYGPVGQAARFAFTLDPTVSEGSRVMTWTNQSNPDCAGDIVDP